MINIIGAGFAGVEAAWALANRNLKVTLYEMRPHTMTPAHQTGEFAELVCSNSFRSNSLENAVGVLKEEMRCLGSLVLEVAEKTQVKAGGALAVDRTLFSKLLTEKIENHPNITVSREEVTAIPHSPTIIATGPLTSDHLAKAIQDEFDQEALYFFDAAAPIITAESIDMNICYLKSRYDKGEAAYLNCPMTEDEFNMFYDALIEAKCVVPKDFELKVFEACMPIEIMAKRGRQTLTFGPMKPVGLQQENKERPYAVVQLRAENTHKTLYNLVGFQTHLTWGEQKKIIKMIPGLENAEIVRYGVMHRNTYIHGPSVLKRTLQTQRRDDLFFAGQITGVEGYVESAASGILAGINMARLYQQQPLLELPNTTMLGALSEHVTTPTMDYQPMHANFGILEPLPFKHKKKERKALYATRALETLKGILAKEGE